MGKFSWIAKFLDMFKSLTTDVTLVGLMLGKLQHTKNQFQQLCKRFRLRIRGHKATIPSVQLVVYNSSMY